MAEHYHNTNIHPDPQTRDPQFYHLAPPPPGQYGHYPSVSSFHSNIGSYNTGDYLHTGDMFREMVHQLAENNTRSNLTTALESSKPYNTAMMLPIAWEETYPKSIGIKEDIHSLVHGESFHHTTVMPNIKLGADNIELATIVSQSTQLILCTNMIQEVNVTVFPTSEHK